MIDPVWLMGDFNACMEVDLPNGSQLTSISKYGQIEAAYINGNPIPTDGLAYSFGYVQSATHTYYDNPLFTVSACAIPEPSAALLGLLGSLALLRRKR